MIDQLQNGFALDRISHILNIAIEVFIYTGLIFAYWSVFNILNSKIQTKIKNQRWQGFYSVILSLITICLTIFTLVLAFYDNLTVFFGSLSVLSAALVFALQDFVSCFFAWVNIEITKQYRVGDMIQIQTSDGKVTGWIKEIGMFRTQVRERVGDDSIDRERPTGKIVTFPNNFIFKYALSNQTKNHLVLWHTMQFEITFESDLALARKVLQKALDKKFEQLLNNPDYYLQDGIGDLNSFRPKFYNSIKASGVGFNIWFGARAGLFLEVLESYSLVTLETFKKHNINLAYNTNRLVKLD